MLFLSFVSFDPFELQWPALVFPHRDRREFTRRCSCTNCWHINEKEVLDMARNTSIPLGDHFATFIDTQVEGGRYGSASDVVRAGLRLLEEHEGKVRALEAALIAGEESGQATEFDFEAFKARKRAVSGSGAR